MGDGPLGCCEELVAVRIEPTQILEVPAPRALVHGRVELEADHVEATGEPGDETAVFASLQALDEAARKAKIKKRLGTEVDPIVREPVRACDVDDRDAEGFRHWSQA